MEKRELICIGCPLGCMVTVEMENGEIKSVTGNTCKRGDDYARKEVTNPTRIVTSTVMVKGGNLDMVSVKTRNDIPKGKIFDCVRALKGVCPYRGCDSERCLRDRGRCDCHKGDTEEGRIGGIPVKRKR